jgi:hypothetical protein
MGKRIGLAVDSVKREISRLPADRMSCVQYHQAFSTISGTYPGPWLHVKRKQTDMSQKGSFAAAALAHVKRRLPLLWQTS